MKSPGTIEAHLKVLEAGPNTPGYLEAFDALERYSRGGVGTILGILGAVLSAGGYFLAPQPWRSVLFVVGSALMLAALFFSPLRRSDRVRKALDGARDHVNRLNVERARP